MKGRKYVTETGNEKTGKKINSAGENFNYSGKVKREMKKTN